MLKIILPEDVECLDIIGEGSTAYIYETKTGDVFKKFKEQIPLCEMFDEVYKKKVCILQHFINLSGLDTKTFCSPKGIVVSKDCIIGIVMKKVEGELIHCQNLTIKDMFPFEEQVREDIVELSKKFIICDLNMGSIFFSKEEGFSIVDLDFYTYVFKDLAWELELNLVTFYKRILDSLYNSIIVNDTMKMFNKGIDYIRFEVVQEVIEKNMKKYSLPEEYFLQRKLLK